MKNPKINILICDDDKYFRLALKSLLKHHGQITEASTEAEAKDFIKDNFFDMALIDMDIDGPYSGIEILKKTAQKKIHSIILSSQNCSMAIEKAYQNGCHHFLTKRHFQTHLEPYIEKFKKFYLNDNLSSFFQKKFITQNTELKHQIKELCKINLQEKCVFITGETGVGKSLIGELLHSQTYDQSKPFIHLNCAEIPEDLIEAELFGYKKGAFTGAQIDKKGKLELAHNGTLFLDEIGTMSSSMQNKLLKAIEQKTFYPVGSEEVISSNFTLITATCEDIFEKIQKGLFRKDLFFRISGHNLDIKPLRQRKDDIPLLIEHFLNQSPRRFIIKEDAIDSLLQYGWPGNIRELKKQIELLSSKDKGIIYASDISWFYTKSN